MDRRTLLAGFAVGISSTVAGCLGGNGAGTSDNGDTERNDTDSSDSTDSQADEDDENDDTDRLACSFYVEIVDDPPADAPVSSAAEHDLTDSSILERIFDKATDPDASYGLSKRRGGEFEHFIVAPNSNAEFEAAQAALRPLPDYSNYDYPTGTYVEYDDTVVAITVDCVT